ncbi:hypothetical protein VE03_10450 [Pseudogymnoascus sp. 23342-1-I1]|nr:hypothetical protein VE03_10450 [Pseudogymnoascus sp. 23342-1-I1]
MTDKERKIEELWAKWNAGMKDEDYKDFKSASKEAQEQFVKQRKEDLWRMYVRGFEKG